MYPTTLFLPLLSRQHRYRTAIPTLQHPPAKPGLPPPTAMQAVISCQVTKCPDSEQEKKDAVNGLTKVLTEVTKKRFGSRVNVKFAYVKPGGGSILASIEQMRKESDKMFKRLKRLKRLEKKLAEVQKESNKLAEAQKEFDKKFETFKLTMQPLEAIAIAIRGRFFSKYKKQTGMTPGHHDAIKRGHIAAHHGDVITDTPLVTSGRVKDTDIYRSPSWISPEQAEPYFNSKIMVEMINKRATMRADFRPGSKPWDVGRQEAFEKVLSFWNNDGSEERRKFEDIDGDGLQEERKWLSIACA
ncbi:hypothetical protein L873DRAFT_1793708 [Choiromyces venosus 120613-1]|uniref:Uncharacterized protein n=1 Tax=Choiromyces venosus 120613-1 TaxID=1336337 RepID=A0A3N4J7V7_9PEZI|nr:hypothetical protein L873DRAFT_1793708 [Choiromyces venosus 120613-1]